jgi:hypothetical protein
LGNGLGGTLVEHTADVIRDPDALRRLVAERTFDLRALDLLCFRRWVSVQFPYWQADPLFAQRARIRDLRKAHPELRRLKREMRRAAEADAATPQAARLGEVEKTLRNAEKAVAGLTSALEHADDATRLALEAKREAFRRRLRNLEEEWAQLARSSPERQCLLRAAADYDRLRSAIGLDHEEARLRELLTEKGRRAGDAGEQFEERARAITVRHIVPEVGADGGDLHVLNGVRLGAAGVELDFAVVRRPAGPDESVEVLAVVEAKRNINDLAHGFRRRQVDLAWLTGDAGAYDPADHRTGHFTSGDFDRPAVHWQDGQAFLFGPGSFQLFAREMVNGHFLSRLYLVTRAGPIWGVSGAALARISFRAATDVDWNPDDESYLSRFHAWCRSIAGPVETPEVLKTYLADVDRCRQIIVES